MTHDGRNNNAQGRKKSKFPALQTIPADATLDFVSGGTNFKITLADFLASLGVTGTIVQEGDVLGTPILDTAGTVHNIRNLENGPGVKASVSPQNGAKIEHNFTVDDIGVPIIPDPTLQSPLIRSLIAGAGINVAAAGDQIQISTTDVPATTKTVVVNVLADFPAPVAGVITLLADTEYFLSNDVNAGANRFVLQNNTSMTGSSPNVITLTYTGTGDMFTSVDAAIRLSELTFSCPNARFLNASDSTNSKALRLIDFTVSSCDKLALISGFIFYGGSSVVAPLCANGGFELSGTLGTSLFFSCVVGVTTSGACFDLSTAVTNSLAIESCVGIIGAGAFFLDGLTGSANITSIATVINTRISGAGTPLNNITIDDVKWVFVLNDAIPNTRADSLSYNTAGVTVTIPAVDTPTKIAGTWVNDNSSQFTVDGTGRVTYNGTQNLHVPIDAVITTSPVSGSNKDFTVYIAINGTIAAPSGILARGSSGDRIVVGVIWQHIFAPGDFIEVFIENETDAVNFQVDHAVLRVN